MMNNNIIYSKRIGIRMRNPLLALMLFTVMFMCGCMREDGYVVSGDDDAMILVTVNLPDAALPTRGVANEDDIGDLRILVFERIGNDYFFLYQSDAQEISASGGNQRFQAQLLVTDKPLKLMVLANTGNLKDASYTPVAGDSEAVVREAYEFSLPAAGFDGDLPMYGEYILEDGLVAGNNSITIAALRAIARVDVTVNLIPGSGDFILEEVYAFRAYDSGRMIPDPVADISAPIVNSPSIPTGALFLSDPISIKVPGGADAIEGLYIPESYAAQNASDRLKGTTTIVIGGRYNGSDKVTYYRADLDPDGSGTAFGQALRNHRYIFNITKVSAPGWDKPDEAAENFNSSIIIEIQAWEDFTADISYGIDKFKISARSLHMRYVADRTKVIDIESARDYTIQWLDASGNPTGGSIPSSSEGTILNDDFEVSISLEPADADQTQLVFRTLHDNYTGTMVITHKLRITVGLSTIDITVNQDCNGLYSDRSFNVLTGYDNDNPFAYLGTTATQDYWVGASYYPALAMRRILDVNFAPSGTVRIGGFSFDMVSDLTDYFGATTNTTTIERIIRQQDVIFLTYQAAPTTQVATLLRNWLNADPHRVLIVAADNANTNINARNLNNNVTWAFNSATSTNAFTAAAASAETVDFFNGPFGSVGTTTIGKYDETFGYSTNHPNNVIPLIVRQANTSAMIVGVDKASRIIYIGDTNLFQHTIAWGNTGGPMNNDNGTVSNDLDRLMANMWAWVVEQLIYGND